ncbi:nucleoside diphosphate kinase III, chloroplastic/mitochondrial-like isoform X1 [Abrus precatorius]|uniref:Nucleoside diphosphate kinase n=1 Tax=Abrus precatorius TaxID=3816 RepID=A0A8B8K8G6_ABRPR|nr:nucleoside diphosphate kinase III, chloroplastic/mitochondrial-like isoform X1 [Abrus precatorius]
MDDSPSKLKIIPDHFQIPTSSIESPESRTSSITEPATDQSSRSLHHQRTRRKLRTAFMLNLFTLRGLPWGSSSGGQEKVELTVAELESLRSELADIEEREAHLKAQLEHVDEVLRSARLSGYLYIRTRWAALPGEPPPIDDTEVDDWLPRFVVLHGECIFLYLLCTDLSPQDSTLLSDIVEVGKLPCLKREDNEIQHAFYILTRHGLRYECSSSSKIQVDSWLSALQSDCKLESDTSVCKSASRAARSLLSASKASRFHHQGRAVGAAAAVSFSSKVPFLASNYGRGGSESGSKSWISGALALPAAAYLFQDQEVHAAELERTFIAIKPDGVQRGLISEIISRFERKGYKLVGIKVVIPSKEFAQQHYHDLKERPFFNGLCEFLSSGPVVAMVWEGEGVISYGRKLIGATDPQKSEPGTIRGDLAVVVGRNIIHGSDGPQTAKDEIKLWFKPEELISFTSNAEKWIYGAN